MHDFHFRDTSLGILGVVTGPKGLCWATLDQKENRIMQGALDRFPGLRMRGQGPAEERAATWVEAVVGALESPMKKWQAPMDVAGTPFQKAVWQGLLDIPAGQVLTYGQVARLVGHPGAARAVGSACGANPLPFLVPCHRVVASGGGLGGFGLGPEIKRRLLEREGVRI